MSSDSFLINFDAQATVEQEIILIKDDNGNPTVSKEELITGLNNGDFFTSLNSLENPYIIRINKDGSIQNIAIIRDSRVCTELGGSYSSFEMD